ncbi:MAG: PEP-CTERM sorting domain-containing protein, partial [Cyanobacteria bacterium P01_A01_bin.17]
MSAASLALVNLKPATAVSLTFTGSISSGEAVTDTVPAENSVSQDSFNPANWDYWTFEGIAGESERFTARRLTEALDPALGIWFGTETDTDSYTSLFGDSLNTTLVASADDEINA